MTDLLRRTIISFLKLPPEPPAPFGEERSLRVFRASPQFFKYRLVTWGIGQAFALIPLGSLAIGFIVGGAVAMQKEPGAALLILAGLAVVVFYVVQFFFSLAVLRLDYEMRWYKVTDRSLRIREGVWFVREMTMTFVNIQNIEISQGPIQRWLGISDLKVQTAGGGGAVAMQAEGGKHTYVFNMHVGFFRGVDNAPEILTLMQERLRRSRSGGLGDHDDAEEDRPAAAAPSAALPSSLIEAAKGMLEEARAFRVATQKLAP